MHVEHEQDVELQRGREGKYIAEDHSELAGVVVGVVVAISVGVVDAVVVEMVVIGFGVADTGTVAELGIRAVDDVDIVAVAVRSNWDPGTNNTKNNPSTIPAAQKTGAERTIQDGWPHRD